MNRRTSLALVGILVVAAVAAPLGAAAAVSSPSSADGQSETGTDSDPAAAADGNDSIAPGERLAGVVGAQQAEIDGEVSERAYGVRIANARSDAAKAAVVAEQINESERRLEALERRLAELNESREAGEISEGRYRAEVATTVAEMRALERRMNLTAETAAELPDSVRTSQGIDPKAIEDLRNRAGARGGPETAAIGRSVVGNDERAFGADRDPGPPFGGDRNDGGSDGGDGDGGGDDSDDAETES